MTDAAITPDVSPPPAVPGRPSSPTPPAPVRPAAPTAPAPSRPSDSDLAARRAEHELTPQQRFARAEASRREADPFLSSKVLTRDEATGQLRLDGRPVDGADPPPGEQQPTPAESDKPKVRIGDSVHGFEEVSEEQIQSWRTEAAAQASRRATLPASADLYEVKLPESFKAPAGFENWKPDENHVLMGQAKQFAHKIGLSQSEFSELLALHGSQQVGTAMMLQRARDAEVAKLGSNGTLRVGAVQDFIRSVAGDELFKQTQSLLATAAMVQVWERVMQRAGVTSGSSFSGQRSSESSRPEMTDEIWNSMSYGEKKAYSSQFPQR
jgi:hypothetical protein